MFLILWNRKLLNQAGNYFILVAKSPVYINLGKLHKKEAKDTNVVSIENMKYLVVCLFL